MTSVQGQASAEYAGLLALAAVIGAMLALVAGPPLVHAMRGALVAALSDRAGESEPRVASAADIADVQSALVAPDGGLSPDAALVALARRNGAERAREIADVLLLEAARAVVPWIGKSRTYRAWIYPGDGPYEAARATTGERDIETPTGPPVVAWLTVAAQRRALSQELSPAIEPGTVAIDLASMIPAAPLGRALAKAGIAVAERGLLEQTPRAVGVASDAKEVLRIVSADSGGVPAGMRVGDIVIAWPVRRTFSRDGTPAPPVGMELGVGSFSAPSSYVHTLILRATANGLRVVAEGGP